VISSSKNLYLTTHNIHNKHPCPLTGFEHIILSGERPQTQALHRVATGTCISYICGNKIININDLKIIINFLLGVNILSTVHWNISYRIFGQFMVQLNLMFRIIWSRAFFWIIFSHTPPLPPPPVAPPSKVQVKCSRYRPGVAQMVGRGVALLFHDRGTRRWWVVSSTPRPNFTPGKDSIPILQEAGWAPGPFWTGVISRPHRVSIPDRATLAPPSACIKRHYSEYVLCYHPVHPYYYPSIQKFPVSLSDYIK